MVTKLKDIPRAKYLKIKHPEWAVCYEKDYKGLEKECPICGYSYELVGKPREYFYSIPVCSDCIYTAVMDKYDIWW